MELLKVTAQPSKVIYVEQNKFGNASNVVSRNLSHMRQRKRSGAEIFIISHVNTKIERFV